MTPILTLTDRKIYSDGTVICEPDAVIEMLYQDLNIDGITVIPDQDIDLYNKSAKFLDSEYTAIDQKIELKYGDQVWEKYWFTPEEYTNINLSEWFASKCHTQQEHERVLKELNLYEKNSLITMLYHLIYLVDYWRANKILWGVGRGSSVNSFLLYLIGINRVNPMKFDLQIEDFLSDQ